METQVFNNLKEDEQVSNVVDRLQTLEMHKKHIEQQIEQKKEELGRIFKARNVKSINFLEEKLQITHTTKIRRFNALKTYETFKEQHPDFEWMKPQLNTEAIKTAFKANGVYDEIETNTFKITEGKK